MNLSYVNPARLAQSRGWFRAFVVGVGICLLLVAVNSWISELSPGNDWGLSYGIAATVFLGGAAVYGVRRRTVRRAPGASYTWLQFHVYGGALFLLLVLMHTGFRLPAGVLAWAMWLLSVWIVLSGVAGVVVQRVIPRTLASGLSTEVHYDRIPELVAVIRGKAERIVETCGASVRDFYRNNLAAALGAPQARLVYYLDITGGVQARLRHFHYVRELLAAEDKDRLDELEALFRTKLEMDAHYTLQRALRWWSYGHVPVSLILTVLVAFHIFSITYY